MIEGGRPLTNVVFSPVCGSTRETLPTAPSVTYSAPLGPTVLPVAPSRHLGPGHSISGVAVGPPDGIFFASALPLRRMITQLKTRPIVNLFLFVMFLPYSPNSASSASALLIPFSKQSVSPPFHSPGIAFVGSSLLSAATTFSHARSSASCTDV